MAKDERIFGLALRAWRQFRSRARGMLLRALVFGSCGPRLSVGSGLRVREGGAMTIGARVKLGSGCRFECFNDVTNVPSGSQIEIGDYVHFGDNVHVGAIGSISIGKGALFGSNILIIDHNHGYADLGRREPMTMPKDRALVHKSRIEIEENCWICDGVKILGGARIKSGSIVPAGTTVKGEWDK